MTKIMIQKHLLFTLFALILSDQLIVSAQDKVITDFSSGDNSELQWRITDDGVMGGRSKGQFKFTEDNTLEFKGLLSLENNGGFSSVRTETISLNLEDSVGIKLRVKGDGRTYQLRLSTDARYRSWEVSFSAEFKTQKDTWIEVRVPFSDFQAGFRGRSLRDVSFDPSKISRIGILLGDKTPGSFELELDSMVAYGSPSGNTIADFLAQDSRFSTLVAAISKTGLTDALSDNGSLTVFAPTNQAFSKLPEGTLESLLKPENETKLISILKYHVAGTQLGLTDLLAKGSLVSLQGSSVQVQFQNGAVRVNDSLLQSADIPASNGIIHLIDSVLIPAQDQSKTLLQTVKTSETFQSLMAAVEAAGLSEVLETSEALTLLAPSDQAFELLPPGTVEMLLKPENRQQLQSLLANHAVQGLVTAGDALKSGSATTLGGETLRFNISEGLFQVNSITISEVDLNCANGVIHTIDRVLQFPTKITTKSQQAASSNDAHAKMNVRAKIVAAIHRGVPLYNNGHPAACAETYQTCIRSLAANAQLSDRIKADLAKSLEQAEGKSADERAWLFRFALDETLAQISDHSL